jgi:histidinol dehydrogenase
MKKELQKILISYISKNFEQKLISLCEETLKAAGRIKGWDNPENKKVLEIIRKVDQRRDKDVDNAIIRYTKLYDKVKLTRQQLRISESDLKKSHKEINRNLLASIRKAISNVRQYQKAIFIGKNKKFPNGTGIKYTPIKSVGICVPGASAPLPSTIIMTAVPAQVAGVEKIVVISPPRYNGSIHPVTLAVCYELGLTEVYRVGGAQAVAALASRKGTIPQVDKIVGPGNRWVQTAKKHVALDYVAIDSGAGPSEVLIISNGDANPSWVAIDMLSQAEHFPGSAVLFTDSKSFAHKVLREIENHLKKLTRAENTLECLLKYSLIAYFKNMNDVLKWANIFASEHVEILCGKKSRQIAEKIQNAGALFIGDYSPVAVGDYFAGPSHTLPTGTRARFSSALTSNDFIKSISIIDYGKQKLSRSADDIIRLAQAEGLDAHAKSVKIRFKVADAP